MKKQNMNKNTYVVYRDGIEEKSSTPVKAYHTRDGHRVEEYTVDEKPRFFVTLKGLPYCAHGDSLIQAIADAVWKDPEQRPSKEDLKQEIQKAGKDRKISLQEFRLLTGACETGCRVALRQAQQDTNPKTVKEICEINSEWGEVLLSTLEWKMEKS